MKELIQQIEKKVSQFNLELTDGAEDKDIEIFVSQSLDRFNYKIPFVYIEFLKIVNGIFYNGIEIYATNEIHLNENVILEGFIEANEIWRDDEDKKKYIVFAESGDALYVHNLTNNEYEYVDRITLDIIESKQTCEELFDLILNHILENYD